MAKTDVQKAAEDNAKVAEGDLSDEVKCDNHPRRKARTFTSNNAIKVNLCEECTPPWFKDADAAL